MIAGLDAEFVTAIVIPDLAACATMLSLPATLSFEVAAREPRLIAWLQERLLGSRPREPREHALHPPCRIASGRAIARPRRDHG